MAIMCPEVPIDFEPDSREDFIFDALSNLPDNYYVFHSLTLLQKKRYGISEHEIDFVVFEQTKGILCIEAKAGQIHYCDGAWRYGNGDIIKHNGPFKQASAFSHKLKEHLRQTYPDEYIDYYTIDGFACSLCQTSESDYEKLQEKLLECGVNGTFPYKHVIIDEGQDFGQDKIDDAEIIDLLYDIVYDKNNGSSFYLFYDKNQLVQGRKLPDCIANADCRLTLYRNCRNTENIATSSLRFLGSKKPPKVFERAIRGSSPTLLISTDEASQIRTINEMIDKYSDAYGNSIVILTCLTVENSLLSSFRDGEYYRYNGKKVLFTTCRKFKGLESDVVILIDVTQKFMLEQEYKNIVYVGTSRARFELCVVTSLSDNEISEVLATENIKKRRMLKRHLRLF